MKQPAATDRPLRPRGRRRAFGLARRFALAVAAVVAGTAVATVVPTAAHAISPGWRPYGNKNPITTESSLKWNCAKSAEVGSAQLVAQVCVVRNSTATQTAIIVRNGTGSLRGFAALATLFDSVTSKNLASTECPNSGVAANSWSVCYSFTAYTSHTVLARGNVNEHDLPEKTAVWPS